MPVRIQRKRTKGWKMPEGAVYVGRPSKWGNPFIIGETYPTVECVGDCTPIDHVKIESHVDAVVAHRSLMSSPDWPDHDNLHELRGKDLVCWCPLDQPCHADVLLELANKEP